MTSFQRQPSEQNRSVEPAGATDAASNEERLRLALAIGQLATWDWDVRTGSVIWSREHFAMQGYAVGEIEPSFEAWLARVHPEDRTEAVAVIEHARANRVPYRHEFRTLLPGEIVRNMSALGLFFYDEAGAAIRMIGVMRDLTTERIAEVALRKSEERRELALEAAEMGAWDYDLVTRVCHYDQRARLLYNVPSGVLDHDPDVISRVVHPDDLKPMFDAIGRATELDGDGRYQIDYRLLQSDGGYRWLRAWGKTEFAGEGGSRRAVRIVGASRDITAEKETERQREELHNELVVSKRSLAAELATARQLQAISTELISTRQPDSLYEKLLESAMVLMKADAASVQVLDRDGRRLRLLASRNFQPESAAFWWWVDIKSKTSCGEALKMNNRVVIEDIDDRDEMNGSQDLVEYRRCGIRAAQSTPLISREGRRLGMLSTYWKKKHRPMPRDFDFFDVLARQAADLLERSQAQFELRTSEERLRRVLDGMGEGFGLLAPDFTILEHNREALRLDGRSRETIVGRSQWDVFPGSETSEFGRLLKKAMTERVSVSLEHRYSWEDGRALWLEMRAYPMDDGSLAVFCGDVTKRREAQEALRQSEEKYRALFVSMDEAYAVVDIITDHQGNPINFRFVEVNPAFEEHTNMHNVIGRTATEILGTPNPRWAQTWGQVARTGEPLRFEEHEPTLDRTFDLYVFRLGGEGSRRVAVLFSNITERKRAEAKRREAEEALTEEFKNTKILQSLGARFVTAENVQTVYEEILSAAIAITRAKAGTVQLLDANTQELVIIATRGFNEPILKYFERVDAGSNTPCGLALRTEERSYFNFDPTSTDVSIRLHVANGVLSAQSSPLVSRAGKAIGMVSTHWADWDHHPSERELRFLDLLIRQAADLIEQRAAEKALRASEERQAFLLKLSDAIRSLADPVAIQREALRVLRVHLGTTRALYAEALDQRGGMRITAENLEPGRVPMEGRVLHFADFTPGALAEALAGHPLWRNDVMGDIHTPEQQAAYAALGTRAWAMIPVLKEGRFVAKLTVHAAEPRSWAPEELRLIQETTERTWAAVERARAETALRESEARLQENDRRKNHFLAMLGHELRNPLAAIHSGLRLLASPKAKSESKKRALPTVLEQTAHMERLVDDLLEITRVVQGRITLRKTPMSIQEAVRQALDMCRAPIESAGFDVILRMPAEPLLLEADTVRLTQVFVNIISNALKYSGNARRLEIEAARQAAEIVVRVRDHGRGIPAELLSRIFDPFVQALPGLTLDAGMGMGLAVVKELVRLHGGQVQAFSAGPDQGAEFVVRLPITPSPTSTADISGLQV